MKKNMNVESLEELYTSKFGSEFNWNNMNGLINEIIQTNCDKQKKVCSDLYIEKTTMQSTGKFVGDKRIVEMLNTAPSPEQF